MDVYEFMGLSDDEEEETMTTTVTTTTFPPANSSHSDPDNPHLLGADKGLNYTLCLPSHSFVRIDTEFCVLSYPN